MDFTDTHACRKRTACGDCRSRPEWRKAMGAPDVCPFPAATPPLPTLSLPEKRAICTACEHFQRPACCNCPTARQDPARELNSCLFGKWDLAPETAGATLRETTGDSHALGNRQLENPG